MLSTTLFGFCKEGRFHNVKTDGNREHATKESHRVD